MSNRINRRSTLGITELRTIMGDSRVWGVEESVQHYGASFTDTQLRRVDQFPWGEDVLNAPDPFYEGKRVKETHVAVLGRYIINSERLSIMRLHDFHRARGPPRLFNSGDYGPWYNEEPFANEESPDSRWYLMPLEVINDFTSKIYEEQVQMLPPEYEVPLAVEEVVKDLSYYIKNRVYLNAFDWGRCRDVSAPGSHVLVGRFNTNGLLISEGQDSKQDYFTGLAASRRLPG